MASAVTSLGAAPPPHLIHALGHIGLAAVTRWHTYRLRAVLIAVDDPVAAGERRRHQVERAVGVAPFQRTHPDVTHPHDEVRALAVARHGLEPGLLLYLSLAPAARQVDVLLGQRDQHRSQMRRHRALAGADQQVALGRQAPGQIQRAAGPKRPLGRLLGRQRHDGQGGGGRRYRRGGWLDGGRRCSYRSRCCGRHGRGRRVCSGLRLRVHHRCCRGWRDSGYIESRRHDNGVGRRGRCNGRRPCRRVNGDLCCGGRLHGSWRRLLGLYGSGSKAQ